MKKTQMRSRYLSLQSRGLVCGDFFKKLKTRSGRVRNTLPGIIQLNEEECWEAFENQTRKRTGMGGLEWLAAYEEGILEDSCCSPNAFIEIMLPLIGYRRRR